MQQQYRTVENKEIVYEKSAEMYMKRTFLCQIELENLLIEIDFLLSKIPFEQGVAVERSVLFTIQGGKLCPNGSQTLEMVLAITSDQVFVNEVVVCC